MLHCNYYKDRHCKLERDCHQQKIEWKFLDQGFLNVFQEYEEMERGKKQKEWERGLNPALLPY